MLLHDGLEVFGVEVDELAFFEVHGIESASDDLDGVLSAESAGVSFESSFVGGGCFGFGHGVFGRHVVHRDDAARRVEEDDVDVDEAITHEEGAESGVFEDEEHAAVFRE